MQSKLLLPGHSHLSLALQHMSVPALCELSHRLGRNRSRARDCSHQHVARCSEGHSSRPRDPAQTSATEPAGERTVDHVLVLVASTDFGRNSAEKSDLLSDELHADGIGLVIWIWICCTQICAHIQHRDWVLSWDLMIPDPMVPGSRQSSQHPPPYQLAASAGGCRLCETLNQQ